jgi:hypothetical protein
MLILVVEEMLPNGAQAWQEVVALYQTRSGQMVLQDHDNVKRHWVDKCCNKFRKPTGNPGDPKRDMILRCQRIHERILKKSASCIMGAGLEGDKELEVSEDSEDSEEGEDDNEANGDLLGDGDGVAVSGGLMVDEQAVEEELVGGIGSRTQSRGPTPTYAGNDDADGGVGIMALEQLHIAPMPPLQSTAQQSAMGAFHNAPQIIMQQSTEGYVANAPLYQLHYGQALFTPNGVTHPQQQLNLNRDPTVPGIGAFAPLQQHPVPTQQQPAGQQPGANPPQPSTQQSVFVQQKDQELPL